LHLSTTFERAGDGTYPGGRIYSRDASPAYDQAEELLATLEGGDSALLFASGMAAATAVFQALEPGQRVLAPRNMYWALRKWLLGFAEQWKLDLAFYENADLTALEAALAVGEPKLLWIETPANPTWELTDIEAAATLAHRRGAVVAVDATILTPVHARPLDFGADIVMHAATKYLNGHSDLVAGALVARKDAPLWPRIRVHRALGGAVLGPFEAWLLLRGMRTLFPRVRTASASALQLARKVAAALRVFKRATSLGSVESLVEHRASVEGPGTFCPADLLRLSIGIEHVDDLIGDFEQALAILGT
jgi:cystathionine gamma-synthase